MLSRGLVAILAVLGSAAGQQTTKPSGAKGKGTGKGRGAPAKAMNLPELHKLRDEMRSSWCTGGRNAGSAPCQMEAFLLKYRSEPDAAKKKTMMSTHVTEHAEKRKADPAGTKSKFTGDFFGMFNGFCAENPTKEHICKNKQLLHFKSINQI